MSEDLENVDQPDDGSVTGRRLSRRTMIAGTAGAAAAMWAAPAVTSLGSRAFGAPPVGGSLPPCPQGEFACGTTCCLTLTCEGSFLFGQDCVNSECAAVNVDCSPFTCDPSTNSCYTTCQDDTQCATGGPLLVCVDGTCVEGCLDGLTLCADGCVDTYTDPKNCGGCGIGCASGDICSDGMCVPVS